MNLGCGGDTPVDSCKNSCGDYANCNNGVCSPKTENDFYNPATNRYIRLLELSKSYLEFQKECAFYNFSLIDTPWILPSFIEFLDMSNTNGARLNTIRYDKNNNNLYSDYNIKPLYIKNVLRSSNGLITGFNLIFIQEPNSFENVIMNPNSIEVGTKTIVGSWVGKVNPTRDTIDFDIYIYRNKSNLLYENCDTLKVLHRKFYKAPNNRTDCKFCFNCE
jgi:hypothetical protein